ncbi:CHAT domain-containing protein [filamentous cyanobacterium LEGE 11480]|uniref:CHAT domain-containing protein n=1 Tax=Romeriopsis navalis LEGE 11480 TaxID=2777977 RepID=A0A928VT58_9CYAN|nr:CHAT domain-containing protein [Romeriopsis navalis]MBE9032561.1 CHAT domain-containing protein [Romeriopsis navalis LEGE 11480]
MATFLKSSLAFCLALLMSVWLAMATPAQSNNAQVWLQQATDRYANQQYSRAVSDWQQAIRLSHNPLMKAVGLGNLALTYHQLGQVTAADQALQSSLEYLQQAKNSTTYAHIKDIQAVIAFDRGQYQTALSHWSESSKIYAQNNSSRYRLTQLNQARAMQALGQLSNAEKILEQLSNRAIDQADPALLRQEQLSLAAVYVQRGAFNLAQQVLDEVDQSTIAPPQQATWQMEQANLQGLIAEHERGLEASRIYQASSSCPTFNRKGNAIINGQPNAYQQAQKAIESYRQIPLQQLSASDQLENQLNQLTLLRELSENRQATNLIPQITQQFSQQPLQRSRIFAQINLAQSLICLNARPNQIEQLLKQAIQDAQTIHDTRAESYVIGTLGHLYETLAAKNSAQNSTQWQSAQTFTEQALSLSKTGSFADINYKWEWQLGRILAKSQNNLDGAIVVYSDAVKTLKSVRNQLLGSNPNTQFSFRDQVEPVYRELIDLLLQHPATEQPTPARLNQAIQLIDNLQVAELENFVRCITGELVPVDEIIQNIDQSNQRTAIVYPIVLNDRLEIITKLPNQDQPVSHTVSVSQTTLEKHINKFLDVLRSQEATIDESTAIAKQFYDWIVGPISTELEANQIKTLVFLPDSSLQGIPMGALWDGQQYLIEKYALAITPSLELLGPKALKNLERKALLAGLTIDPLPPINLPDGQEKRLDPLQFVSQELDAIQALFPNSVTLRDTSFGTLNLRAQLARDRFPIVHLSTHGEFSSNAQRTYIATATGEPITVEGLRELLRLGKQGQEQALELLVFSACQTAKGDRRASLGLAGVAVRSGASSTLATLWSVDESSTTELMQNFYRNLNQGIDRNTTKAEALQQAQIALIQKGRQDPKSDYDQPFYWSPFVLLGNWL